MKSQITIKYPDENYGIISLFLNGIFMDSIEKNQVKTFDLFDGRNQIEIQVTGTTYKKDIIEVEAGKEYIIDGYFSKQRLLKFLVTILSGALTVLLISYWNDDLINWKLYGLYSIVILVLFISKWIIDFRVKKMKYVYLKPSLKN